MDLNGKCVLLGVTGGIAAYKMANVASALRKLGADVEVIMTRNATQFITPITFETLTGHKCMVDTFDRDFKFEVHSYRAGQKGRRHPRCTGHGQRHRQDGPRHCRRHADHHRPRRPNARSWSPLP